MERWRISVFLGWQLCIWGSTWGISGILAEHAGWHPKWYDLAGVGWRMSDHSRNGRRSFFPIYERVSGKFYLHPVAAAGENYDYSSNEIDVLLAQSEVQERLELGMAIRDVDGMDTIRGEACVLFALGTEHPDQFVAEYYYAVSSSGLVYRMDDLTGEWEPI